MTGADDERRFEGNPGRADRGDRGRSLRASAGISGWVALVSHPRPEGQSAKMAGWLVRLQADNPAASRRQHGTYAPGPLWQSCSFGVPSSSTSSGRSVTSR